MTSWPDNGGLFPEGQVEDPTPDDRRADFAPCCHFSAATPSRPYCVCGVHRSWHFAALAEQAGWTRYATLMESERRRP